MSAQNVFDNAPLGSLIRYSNGEPRPPARFTRKLRAWNTDNGTGRLVERSPEAVGTNYRLPASFALHLGNFGGQDVIVMVVQRHYSVTSKLHFEIAEVPKPGMVRVLTGSNGREELHNLATDMAAAEAWLARNRYSDAGFEIVEDSVAVMPSSDLARAA